MKKKKTKQLRVNMEPEVFKAFEVAAENEARTLASLNRYLIKSYLDAKRKDKKKRKKKKADKNFP